MLEWYWYPALMIGGIFLLIIFMALIGAPLWNNTGGSLTGKKITWFDYDQPEKRN